MSDSGASEGPPPFEEVFRGEDVEQRIYGTVLQTREPATARAIAERTECDPKTARKYLGWFTDLGIVTRHDGHPATFERNDAYFKWRRIDHLASEYTVDELEDRVRDLTTRITEYETRYGVETPADVDAIAIAENSDDITIDEVYADLGDWETAREERGYHERARQRRLRTQSGQIPR